MPLISALTYDNRAIKKICIDERAAGYLALGYAKATGHPGVLVCTSGTAPANYYPAVIEASREDIPLVILSADRPPELVGSDANQTIVQQDLYGRYCRDSLLLPCPDIAYPLEALLAKIDRVVSRPSGPVHINCPFRDPLIPGTSGLAPVPANIEEKARRLFDLPKPYTVYARPAILPSRMEELAEAINKTSRGLIIIGRLDDPKDALALKDLVDAMDWPVFCDIASSMKGLIHAHRQIMTLDHPEAIRLIKAYDPETFLQFGSGLVSKHYYASILPQSPALVIQISPRGGLRDPAHRVNLRVEAPVHAVAGQLKKAAAPLSDAAALNRFGDQMLALRLKLQQSIPQETLSFPLIADSILAALPEGEGLFPGNSIAIRAFDAASPPDGRRIRVVSNRGVSGIEGNIATSAGFAEGSGRRVTAVIGDISFLHDLNSLMLLKQSRTPVILIVVNNSGGRIFERLPVGHFPELLNPYMTTPHDMNFKLLADQFDLPYFRIDTPEKLEKAYQQALQDNCSALLEVILSPEDDLRIFEAMQQVRLPYQDAWSPPRSVHR